MSDIVERPLTEQLRELAYAPLPKEAWGRYAVAIAAKAAAALEAKDAEIERLRATPGTLVAEREWRPIETAPKDGTKVLVCCDDIIRVAAFEARWSELTRGVEAKWWIVQDLPIKPTHWQPLPSPPTPTPQGGSVGEIAKMLLAVRYGLGVSQQDFAKALGYSQQYLCDIEKGRRPPSVAFINRVCSHLGRGPAGRLEWHMAGATAHGWEVTPPESAPR